MRPVLWIVALAVVGYLATTFALRNAAVSEALVQHLAPASQISTDSGRTWHAIAVPIEGRFEAKNGTTALMTDRDGRPFEIDNLSPADLQTLAGGKAGARVGPDGRGHGHLLVRAAEVKPRPMVARDTRPPEELRGSLTGTIGLVDAQTGTVELRPAGHELVTVRNLLPAVAAEIERGRNAEPGRSVTIVATPSGDTAIRFGSAP